MSIQCLQVGILIFQVGLSCFSGIINELKFEGFYAEKVSRNIHGNIQRELQCILHVFLYNFNDFPRRFILCFSGIYEI